MIKRLLHLNGLAILAVVLNHAVQWGYMAMFWWTDRYRPVAVPNYDQLYSIPYYALVVLEKLTNFAVPSFLFISGVFIAYTARRTSSRSGEGVALRKRLTNLLVPYLLWSGMIFFGQALQGEVHPPLTYVERVVLGKVVGPYFYVPLLCQFFLLAPLIVKPAREKWRALLLITAGIQLALVGLTYVGFVGELLGVSDLAGFRKQIPTAFFGRFVFFFSLGVVCGFRPGRVQTWVAEHRRVLILLMFISAGVAIVESQLAYRFAKMDMGSQVTSIPSTLYALTIMFLLLSSNGCGPQTDRRLAEIGKRSYGIYLLHPVILEIVARTLQKFLPGVLAHPWLFLPLLIIPGLGLPLIFMNLITRTPLRKHYRYLFG